MRRRLRSGSERARDGRCHHAERSAGERQHAGAVDSNGHVAPPQAIFFVGSNPYVVDTGNARILGYNPFDQWPAESTAFSPPAQAVIGQIDFSSAQSNQGLAQPNATTLAGPQPNPFVGGPVSAAFDGAGTSMSSIREITGCSRFPNSSSGLSPSPRGCSGQSDFRIQFAQPDRWPRSWL